MHHINFYEIIIKLKIITCVKTNSAQNKQEPNPDLSSESEHHFSHMNARTLPTGVRPTLLLPVFHSSVMQALSIIQQGNP